jgi:hypothetical protein
MTALPPTERRHLGLLMAYAFVLFACGLWWGLPLGAAAAAPPNSSFTWTGDELHPSTWGQATNPRALNAWHTRYPPMHFALLQAGSWPLRAAVKHGLIHLDRPGLLLALILYSRLVSLAMAMATLWMFYRLAREVLDEIGSLWSVFVLASVMPYVYYAKMANLEAPYLMWFTLSLWMFVRILSRHQLRDYLLFGAAAAAAVCTKDQAYGLYGLAPIPIVYSLWKREYGGKARDLWRAVLDRRLLLTALVAGLGFVVFQDLIFNPHRFTVHLRLLRGPMSENYQDYAGTPLGQWQLFSNIAGLLTSALNPALLATCLVGLVWTFLRLREAEVWKSVRYLCSTSIFLVSYYVHLPGAHPVLLRPLRAADDHRARALRRGGARGAGAPVGSMADRAAGPGVRIAAYSVLYAASVDFRLLADTRYEVERWVAGHAREPGSVIAVGRHHHIARFRWVRWERALAGNGEFLSREQPEMVTVNLTDVRSPAESAFIARLGDGSLGYRLALQTRGKPLLDLVLENDNSSQRFINPEMAVFERVGPPTAPADPATAAPTGDEEDKEE